jgi:hypothetical protein
MLPLPGTTLNGAFTENSQVFFCSTEACVELLDTEGRVIVSACAEPSGFLNIVCHFAVVTLSKSLKSVWSEGAGFPSRWYMMMFCR